MDMSSYIYALIEDLLKDPVMLIEINLLIGAIVYSFVWSIICHNYSKVDQIWSVIPIVYVWIYFFQYPVVHYRLLVLCILVTLWGSRLTFNFWRKGGY
jgi:steroid 5-alpha reductase family enzyme